MGLFDIFSKKKDRDDAAAEELDSSAAQSAAADDSSDAEDRSSAEEAEHDAVTGPFAAEQAAEEAAEDEEDAEFAKAAPLDRAENGPFDSEEDAPEVNRLDLGALRIPVRDGMQVRLDAEEKTNRIVAVTVHHNEAALQLQVFAAPTSEGVWNTTRQQIAENIEQRGGTVDELYTELGSELLTRIPATAPDGRKGLRIARFAGVDGPRWFLRGVFSGRAVEDEEIRALFVEQFRNTIVHRGSEPMPPRELLALTAPQVTQQPDAAAEQSGGKSAEDLNPFERGPEISEVR